MHMIACLFAYSSSFVVRLCLPSRLDSHLATSSIRFCTYFATLEPGAFRNSVSIFWVWRLTTRHSSFKGSEAIIKELRTSYSL